MNRDIFIVIVIISVIVFAGALFLMEEAEEEKTEEEKDIIVFSPQSNQKIKSPLKIEGKARGTWFFEATFPVKLLDEEGKEVVISYVQTTDDWMTEDFVIFEGDLVFGIPKTKSGILRFLSANPSGLPEHQKVFEVPVQFEKVLTREVLLYYYNPENDRDETGNIKCSRDGLVALEREIPISQTPIQDTINLLLEGKLTEEEKFQGITTEYPLGSLKLLGANLEDGVLTLEFEDPLNKTSGGACRVGVLWFQIEATAKQFEEVEGVYFLPEELFQP